VRLDSYQQRARLTAIYYGEIRKQVSRRHDLPSPVWAGIEGEIALLRLSYVGLGLSGEAGEFNNKLKKLIRDNQGHLDDDTRLALARELGDVLWYVSQAAYEIGYRLEEIAQMNLDTLESRKERGKIGGKGDNR